MQALLITILMCVPWVMGEIVFYVCIAYTLPSQAYEPFNDFIRIVCRMNNIIELGQMRPMVVKGLNGMSRSYIGQYKYIYMYMYIKQTSACC